MSSQVQAIGIDLGTTYSVVSVFRGDQPEIIHNDLGGHTTASWVAFNETERIVGDIAKDRSVINPTNSIFGVKRFIGRTYDDEEFQQNIAYYPYKIIDVNNTPMIEVEYKNEVKRFAAIEISAMVLEKMKSLAENFLGYEVSKAVITVPAHFNDAQRQATKDAGRIAGLEVLRIINEPTAAALAYGLHNKYKEMTIEHTILVYDFGGGTFDVSIINIENGVFEVKATNGEAFLGGDDIDILLTNYFIKEFKQKNNLDLNENKRSVRRLRQQCEKLKRTLSMAKIAPIEIDLLHNGIDFVSSMDRAKFEQLNNKLFDKTIACVKKALKDANMKKEDINEIVLVGGSSRIPRVRELVQKFFNNKDLNASLNPDEAVARGAAIQAAILSIEKLPSTLNLLLYDVSPLSLGIETLGGVMAVIIPRNTQIPTRKSQEFTTSYNNQTATSIVVYEGEGDLIKRNRQLGKFVVSGYPSKLRGEVKIDVVFEINTDGILEVTAEVKEGRVVKQLKIDTKKGYLSEDEIQRMIDEAEKFFVEDKKTAKRIKAKLDLTHFCNDIKDILMNTDMTEEDNKVINDKYDEIMEWLDEDNDITCKKCNGYVTEMHNLVKRILENYK